MYMRLVKAKRCARKVPRCWFTAVKAPVASAGQMFQALLAYFVLVILLKTASPEQVDVLADDWAVWIEAFGAAILIWSIVTLLWSPYAVFLEDRRLGKWHGRCFVYREPHLVATIRCSSGSSDQQHPFKFADPEVGSMVYCTVEIQPPAVTVTPQAFGMIRLRSPPSPGSWSTFRVETGRMGNVYVHTSGYASEYTARVYCHQFEMYRAGELPAAF